MNGPMCFEKNSDQFDMVITDMTMPGKTGIELIDNIRAINQDIPIVLCSGFSELINEKKAKELGVNKYLMKPLFKGDLTTEIRDVLDGHKRAK